MSGDGGKSGGPKPDGGSKTAGVWDSIRSFGSGLIDGLLNPAQSHTSRSVSRRDPVASNERPAAARQIHRSMKAWRERDADEKDSSLDVSPAKDSDGAMEDSSEDARDPSAPKDSVADSKEAESSHDPAEEQQQQSQDHATEQYVEAEKPSQSVAAKLKGIHRKVFLSPASTTIFRASTGGVSASKMFSPHDGTRSAIGRLKTLWDKSVKKDKLRKSAADEAKFSERRAKMEKAFNDKEADYQRCKTTPTQTEVDNLFKFYTDLQKDANGLEAELGDYTKTVEELKAEAATINLQIDGSVTRAKAKAPDPNAIPALQVPDYAAVKQELVDLWAKVNAGQEKEKAADPNAAPNNLNALRELATNADALRQAADRADKLRQVSEAMKPYEKSIDQIIKQTTKEGRPGATEGDGSSEAAAIKEAKDGKQTGGCWHGPKCNMDATGLKNNQDLLVALKAAFPDPASSATIDALIAKAEERRKKLLTGAAAWKASPHFSKAPF